MKKPLFALLALSIVSWLGSIWLNPPPQIDVWWLRSEGMNLTGILSFELMGLIMLLAVRPVWLEKPLGGLDQMYRLHKWAGILAISLGLLHYLLKLSGGLLHQFFTRPPRGPRPEFWLDALRHPAKDLGEWAVWLLGIMLIITLWQRFPYVIWRVVHKILAVVFIVLALHSLVLMPHSYWLQPVGWLLAVTAMMGTACAVMSLSGQIGRKRTHRATVSAVTPISANTLELECTVSGAWQHQPGQFAFLRLAGWEGAHPFTIASAPNAAQTLRFSIKALGDFTRQLPHKVQVGDVVSIEGPYGCFIGAASQETPQVWIAGGIGITPFLAWLEALATQGADAPTATLHYCVRDAQDAIYAPRLQALCGQLPSITLKVHYSAQAGRPTLAKLGIAPQNGQWPSIWFCGPDGLAKQLRYELNQQGMPAQHFHQEAFQMR
ncbi:ferric reductase-like transmembrane domain-containing protein [Chitinibacter tainanensis]|uniref:ferredoxin reductase family protein n=1 Tax=Chitinibacter tainanensis TaxID=230667 RepID=UPI002354803C|nr:ferric reductase-like transmembrane domain-containing protein [Chitinibacter tainanensis]